jgi:hypothetical protein
MATSRQIIFRIVFDSFLFYHDQKRLNTFFMLSVATHITVSAAP